MVTFTGCLMLALPTLKIAAIPTRGATATPALTAWRGAVSIGTNGTGLQCARGARLSAHPMFVTAQRSADQLNLQLQGEWRAAQFSAIEAELNSIELAGARHARVAAGTALLDLSGAWLLREFLQRAHNAGIESSFEGAEPSALRLIERTYTGAMPAPVTHHEWLDPEHAVEQLGRRTVRNWLNLLDALNFIGRVCIALGD